jgi:acyl-CoA synthetase (AMP-forming)/AMP-acid ligase II
MTLPLRVARAASGQVARGATTVSVLTHAGLVRAYRPDRLARVGRTLLRWGLGQAGGAIALADRFPHETGVIDELGSLTFLEMHRRSNALARALADRGVSEADRVAVLCRNSRYFIDATVATAKLGADVLYLNTSFSGPQVAGVVDAERPTLLVHDEEFTPLLEGIDVPRVLGWVDAAQPSHETADALIADHDAGDLRPPKRESRTVILTSGTTGAPKGANRAGGGSVGTAVAVLSIVPLRVRWTTHIAAPLFHTWGWAHFQIAMLMGTTIVLRRRFDPIDCMDIVVEHNCDSLVVIPVMLRRILDAVGPDSGTEWRYDVPQLKVVAASGSALPGDLAREWMDTFGDNLYNTYGSTEVSLATIASPEDLRAAPGTAGRAPEGTIVALFDEHDSPVETGEVGRIFVQNAMLFEGYTSGDSKPVIGDMMATGDIGRFDADGRLFIEGRDDEMIVSGGENVFPQEVEDCLARHPDVVEAAAIGVADADFGQRLRAFVVVRPGAELSAETLRDHVRQNLARFKVPRDVVFLDELPRNATGKVLKRVLGQYDS